MDGSNIFLHAACLLWKGEGSVSKTLQGRTKITATETQMHMCRLHVVFITLQTNLIFDDVF